MKKHRILIADDNKTIHEDFERILHTGVGPPESLVSFEEYFSEERDEAEELSNDGSLNFRLDHAYQGDEALQMVRRGSEEGYPYALVFMDIRMPPGDNGIEAAAKIWEEFPDMEIVLCTAHSDYSLTDIISSLGRTDHLMFIHKPFDYITVVQMAIALTQKWSLNRELSRHIEDISRKNEELKLSREAAEAANRAKSQFLANMSHELRTPMHAILSYSRFGQKKIDTVSREKLIQYFREIEQAGIDLMGLLNDLLDLSKLESGKTTFSLEANDMEQLVDACINKAMPAVKAKGCNLNVVNTASDVMVECDRAKITQVMENLLSNAVRYTPEGKSIEVTISPCKILGDTSDQIPIRGVAIKVSDEGIGLPEDELETVFDKFVQSSRTDTGAGGTGLGLAICREIVKGHSGKIRAENNAVGGADFIFSLPYTQPD